MSKTVIDVSWYQRNLDYDAAVADGVSGVIAKISEGITLEETWWSHVHNAKARNLPWGVYCFSRATTPEQAQAEANEVLYLLAGEEPPMGIWFDIEADKCFESGVDTTAVCSAFIVACNEAGYRAGIYVSSLKCTDYMVNSVRPRLLGDYVSYWIADYEGSNRFALNYPEKYCAGWQYTSHGNIGGVEVDMNEWYE